MVSDKPIHLHISTYITQVFQHEISRKKKDTEMSVMEAVKSHKSISNKIDLPMLFSIGTAKAGAAAAEAAPLSTDSWDGAAGGSFLTCIKRCKKPKKLTRRI
jgi:hypothetical protein